MVGDAKAALPITGYFAGAPQAGGPERTPAWRSILPWRNPSKPTILRQRAIRSRWQCHGTHLAAVDQRFISALFKIGISLGSHSCGMFDNAQPDRYRFQRFGGRTPHPDCAISFGTPSVPCLPRLALSREPAVQSYRLPCQMLFLPSVNQLHWTCPFHLPGHVYFLWQRRADLLSCSHGFDLKTGASA